MEPKRLVTSMELDDLIRYAVEVKHPGVECPCPMCLIMHPGND
jgi:hypothetical protein